MKKEKKTDFQKKIEQARAEEEAKQERLSLVKGMKDSKNRAQQQVDKEWQRYLDAKEKGLDKEAKTCLKMWSFFRRLTVFMERFSQMVERIESFENAMSILRLTNSMFNDLLKINNSKMLKQIKRNVKGYERKFRQFEKFMDDMMGVFDSLFDGKKENWFTKLFKKKKNEMTDKEALEAEEQKWQTEISAYQGKKVENGTVNNNNNGNNKPVDGNSEEGFI